MTRGGKRLGAGRPESSTRIPISVRLPAWLVEWLREEPGSQAAIIEEALIQRERYKMLCSMIKHIPPKAPGQRGRYMLDIDSTQTLDEVVDEFIRAEKHIETTWGTLREKP